MVKFAHGVSGNLAGRPRGIPDRRSQLRDLITSHAPDVIQKVVDVALAGDMTACKLLLDKIVPNIRYSDVPLRLRTDEGSLGEQGSAAVEAMLAGEITPAQAEVATRALLNLAQIRTASDIAERIERLEAESRIRASR